MLNTVPEQQKISLNWIVWKHKFKKLCNFNGCFHISVFTAGKPPLNRYSMYMRIKRNNQAFRVQFHPETHIYRAIPSDHPS